MKDIKQLLESRNPLDTYIEAERLDEGLKAVTRPLFKSVSSI